jgi:hypothetical protein
MRAPLLYRTPIGHLGVIYSMYDSQTAGIYENTTTNRIKLLNFDLKIA